MKIYLVMIAMVKALAALSRKVQRFDPDLARQMRRSSSSVPLNAVEGWHAYGGNRVARFTTAMCEARETMTALEVSVASGSCC
jgi:four helix bundle protein